ncbi:semaphorin-3aa isoform X2 [Electrophorus electricus]|uniref:semaphorin-3aa isoform X2 n=1 Tax=Electrophorus electricus TaxID=8005 RepID=UPI0015D0702E|nr:semaphorin-3aa isoform X2 [Electrophorus electricus]
MDYLIGIVLLLCGVSLPGRLALQHTKRNVPRLRLSYNATPLELSIKSRRSSLLWVVAEATDARPSARWSAGMTVLNKTTPHAWPDERKRSKSRAEMLDSSNLVTFTGLANSSGYDTFLMDEERGRLLVGAEDHVFSFDLVNINRDLKQIAWPATPSKRDECKWAGKDLAKECSNFVRVLQPFNQTHLYVCGTGAFHPICSYLEIGKRAEDNLFRLDVSHLENGRGKSPYDPKMLSSSLLIDGELYSGTSADFMGRDFAIFRTLGTNHPIRTEQHDSRWLNDPKFVGIHLIPESDNPEDDKIFLFFKENAMDGEHTGKATISRVAQLCKNDEGGHRSLVNKWTTFLKAKLTCSVPGLNGIDTYFDELQDVFLMSAKDPKNPVIYAVFTTSSNIFRGSAICMYSMADIRRVFLGPYAHRDGPNYQWVPFQGRVPYPRPGTCPSKTFGGFDSTKDLPDDVITFARLHPAMYNPVQPVGGRPIVVRTNADYQFTQLVVDRVEAEDGQYDVMFIGTDLGTVLKVVTIPRESWHDLEEVVLEEMTVFREPTPITAMELSTKQQQLYLGSAVGISQMPLHRCEVYGKACAECCLARDPYCAWDGMECSRYFPTAKRRTRRQDIRNGDPLSQCSDLHHNDDLEGYSSVEERNVYGVENSSMFLECNSKSQRALIYWELQRPGEEHKHEIMMNERVSHTDRGLLIRSLTQADTGVYHCHAVEHGFIQPLLRLTLQVIPSQRVGELLLLRTGPDDREPIPKHKPWYRDFLSLLEHPDLHSVDEFCEHVWKKERKQRGKKPPRSGLPTGQNSQTSSQNQHDQKAPSSTKATNVPSGLNLPKAAGIQRSQIPQGTTSPHGLSPRSSPSTPKGSNTQESQGQGKRGNAPARRTPPSTAKWKQLQENKRGRNRRTHEQQRPPRSV